MVSNLKKNEIGGLTQSVLDPMLLEKSTGYYHTLYLVGAFENLIDLCVAHELLHGIITHIAVAAKYLHGIGGDALQHVGGKTLCHGRKLADLRHFSVVDKIRNMESELARCLYLHAHVGKHELDCLIAAYWFSEGDTLLRKDILYVCEPSALYKLKKSQIRGACFVCRAQAHVFEKYKAYINAIVVDYDTNTNDIANHLADLFSSMNDYKTRLQHAVLLQKGYQPLFDIAKEMFPGCTILMVDSGYNIVCSANTDFENDILPGADPDAVEHIKRLVKLGFYDKTELDQMAEHGYYNQGDKYLNPVISLPPNVCGCPLIVRSYHESSTFFAFVTCYYYYSNPTLVQQRMFKLLSDSLDDYFQITDYYEHVRPFHQQVIADLIENENSSEDFYRDRCLRLHLPQAGDFRLGLIYVSPSNSVRASHCALQLKAWCAVKNYGVFQYGSTVILLMVDWDSYSVRETVDADKNWQMLSDTLRDIGAYMGISLSFKHISGLSNAYHQAAEAAKQGHKSNMDETLHFYSKYYIDELLDCYEKSYPIDNLCVNQLEKLSGPDRGGSSDLELLYLYLCSERNISLTGKKMNMHRNSVIYRLQRINDSLNLDLGDPDVRFRLMLAFKVLSRKNILNISNRDNTEPSSIVHIE